MNLLLLIILGSVCAVLLFFEKNGAPLTLQLTFKGDVKRETFFLQQWGQSMATPSCAIAICLLDPPRRMAAVALIASVAVAATICFVLKRMLGRVRPNRPGAGRFLGPSLRHHSHRQSFPSSHSACAFALSTSLALLYPAGAPLFWGLAIATALLRYVLDAHWPSDVLVGIAIGYCSAFGTMHLFQVFHPA